MVVAEKDIKKTKTEKKSIPVPEKLKTSDAQIVRAEAKNVNLSPQKLRLVADLIRGKRVGDAGDILRFTRKKGAQSMQKLLKSAIANAENNFDLDGQSMIISKIFVDEGMKLPRYRFASKGRVHKYVRRRSHAVIELSQGK